MSRWQTLRGRLTALAFATAFAAIAILTVAFNLVLERSVDGDANHRLRTQAAAAATTVAVSHGRLVVREAPGDDAVDRDTWVFEGLRAIERPLAAPELQRAAAALAGRRTTFAEVAGHEVRLHAAPIDAGGRQVGTVVVAQSLAPYDRTTDLALVASLGLAAVLLAAVLVLTWHVIGRALAPVREMTRSAADWSAQGDPRRFGATPRPDELGELAATFDELLDRVAASVRHEQRVSAELSHELRTPLARIMAEAELLARRERSTADRREAYASIAGSAQEMSDILETLMAAARADARFDAGRSDVRAALASVRARWDGEPGTAGVALEVEQPDGRVMAGVDREVVERILAPLLDNARRHARGRVRVAARTDAGRVIVTVADDGPGIPPEARDRVFEPGARLRDGDGHGGAGLGLSLARRLARAAGGDVAVDGDGAGASFRVELPA